MQKNNKFEDARRYSLPPLNEEERVYLNVPYMARGFARACHCQFDSERKLWFTGLHNKHLLELIEMYGINEHTSPNSTQLVKTQLKNQHE